MKSTRKNNPHTCLQVRIEGNTFQERNAIDTFANVIKYLGVERVKSKSNIWNGCPLIIKESELRDYDNRYYKKEIEGKYFILSYTNNERRKYFLEKIAEQLHISIDVNIIPKDL